MMLTNWFNFVSSFLKQPTALLIGLLLFFNFSSCGCKNLDLVHQGGNIVQTSTVSLTGKNPTPHFKIAQLDYDPISKIITCDLQSHETNLLPGKLKFVITRDQGTQSLIEGATLKGAVYEITLPEDVPMVGKGLVKTFKVDPGTDQHFTFTFQPIYVEGGNEEPVGDPEQVSWDKKYQLVLKDLQLNPFNADVSCNIANTSQKEVDGLTVHWDIQTAGAKITQLGAALQELELGHLAAGTEKPNQVLGQFDFGGHSSVQIDFWITYRGHTTPYSKQSVTFNAPPVNLKLLAVSPTELIGESNKIFTVKIEKQVGSKPIELTQLELKIKNKWHTNVKFLYKAKEFSSLSGTDLGNIDSELPFTIDPDKELNAYFDLHLYYEGQAVDKLTFIWYKAAPANIFEAIDRCDLEALKKLLNDPTHRNKINDAKGGGHRPLTKAAQHSSDQGSLSFIDLLVRNGANVNLPNNQTGYTPLHYAIINRGGDRNKIIERLLAVPDIDVDLVAYKSGKDTPLHLATQQAESNLVKQLLEKIPKKAANNAVNKLNERGETPLNIAVYHGLNESVEALLQAGADPNRFDARLAYPPLYWSAQKDDQFIITELINHGADVNVVNSKGGTPLHGAAFSGKVKNIKLLIDNGAQKSINIRDKEGHIPLDYVFGDSGSSRFMSESEQNEVRALLTP